MHDACGFYLPLLPTLILTPIHLQWSCKLNAVEDLGLLADAVNMSLMEVVG